MPDLAASTSQPPPPRAKRRWLRWAIILLTAFVLLPLLLAFVIHTYNRRAAERALEAAIAEADRFDPGWRLEDIERTREAIPPEENVATYVLEAGALIPRYIFDPNTPHRMLGELQNALMFPQFDMLPEVAQFLETSFATVPPLNKHLDKAMALKKGRYQITWAPDGFSTRAPQHDKLLDLELYLRYLVMIQVHHDKFDDAWRAGIWTLAIASSIGDESLPFAQSVRKSGVQFAVRGFEYTLAQGTVTDTQLSATQMRLVEEASKPIGLYALRAERAMQHQFFTWAESTGLTTAEAIRAPVSEVTVMKRVNFFLNGSTYKDEHAWLLRHVNEALELEKLAPHERYTALKELQERFHQSGKLRDFYSPAMFVDVADIHCRSIALLNSANAALGVERFRLAHNRWPESLNEVVSAKFLDKVPEDPFDSKPMRFRKKINGVVVFSVGRDGNYAGDALDLGRESNPEVIFRNEFRLWDEAHRRQPARESKK